MAIARKFCEILSVADVLTVIEQRAKESGMRFDVIVEKAGVSPAEWAAIGELVGDLRITQLRDVARAAGVELCAIEATGHAPWTDRVAPTSHPRREEGLYDRFLAA